MKLEKENQLYRIAENQAGFFTIAQAAELKLHRGQIYREQKRGRFERATHGVYRFVQFPASKFEEIHVAVLAAGQEAVVGFESALYLYELSDIIPDEIHIILPRTSSRRRPDIRMHTNHLGPEDVVSWEGLPVTTVARTIADVAGTNQEIEQIELAIKQALQRGMTSKKAIAQQAVRLPQRLRQQIMDLLEEVKL